MIERPKLPTCTRCGLEIVSVGQYVNGEYIHIDCRHGDDELHRLRHENAVLRATIEMLKEELDR